ncbi:MAG: hypothetical protein A3H91_06035 [Gammaproteobacteria bacterium RIFCSPLOWO2_02_FULL_61_13]|nr:MAG: hypothetical protein A3H91_06035 [Gammaproteobacteria bacterium RIFCSPLOWO2_02_FULL_61_13]
MKPWQILFCLVCVLGVPALVKFGETRRVSVEELPAVASGGAAEESGPARPPVRTRAIDEPDTPQLPPSPGSSSAYDRARLTLTRAEQALNAGRNDEVAQNLRLALGAAEEMTFASPERVDTLIQTGVMFRGTQPEVGAALLHQAAAELDLLPAHGPSDQEPAGTLPLTLVHSLYSTLGDHYRLQGRAAEAEQWLRRAVKGVAPMGDTDLRSRLIAGDLFLLAQAHCAAGDLTRAGSVMAEMQFWCAKLADREVASGCRVPNKELPCWSRP